MYFRQGSSSRSLLAVQNLQDLVSMAEPGRLLTSKLLCYKFRRISHYCQAVVQIIDYAQAMFDSGSGKWLCCEKQNVNQIGRVRATSLEAAGFVQYNFHSTLTLLLAFNMCFYKQVQIDIRLSFENPERHTVAIGMGHT